MKLRDHDRPCEHERNWAYKEDRGWMCGDIDCPGGAVVEPVAAPKVQEPYCCGDQYAHPL